MQFKSLDHNEQVEIIQLDIKTGSYQIILSIFMVLKINIKAQIVFYFI